jgi:hypothetical protein
MAEGKDYVFHESPWSEWFASQFGRGVEICDKASEQKIQICPPVEWKGDWVWNITQDGTSVYFRRR